MSEAQLRDLAIKLLTFVRDSAADVKRVREEYKLSRDHLPLDLESTAEELLDRFTQETSAVDAILKELQLHHHALIAGYQAATVEGSRSLLQRVDPEEIWLQPEVGHVSVGPFRVPLGWKPVKMQLVWERMLELQRKQSDSVLAPAQEKAHAAAVSCSAEIEQGDAAAVIARRADALGCNGIVMGTRGMSAIGNLLLGSVATKVVHLANVPVTLVK